MKKTTDEHRSTPINTDQNKSVSRAACFLRTKTNQPKNLFQIGVDRCSSVFPHEYTGFINA
jgi:hypothetical protein